MVAREHAAIHCTASRKSHGVVSAWLGVWTLQFLSYLLSVTFSLKKEQNGDPLGPNHMEEGNETLNPQR